jgi:chromosome partitioning protein
MFRAEIVDANSASVVSGALGIPLLRLSAGNQKLLGEEIMENQTQLNRQQPNIQQFVQSIE